MPTLKNRRVVITGVGPISAIGFGKNNLWNSILKARTGLAQLEYKVEGELWDKFWLHKINNFDINNFKIKPQALKDISSWKQGKPDQDLFYLLAAVKLALEDSNLPYNKDKNNIGLFLTIEHPGFEPFVAELVETTISYLKNNLQNNSPPSQKDILKHVYDSLFANGYDLQTFMYLFLVSKAFDFHGYSLFTSNACASGLFSLESAARQIKFGGSDIAIVAGGDYCDTMFKHRWFDEQGLYAKDGKIKPFSQDANGIVLGDGASALVLEELNSAKKRKARIYAEYLGGGFSLEGWKVTLPQLNSNSYQDAIKQSLKTAGLKPKDIDLINPHGVGIKITDRYEAKAITDVFGENETPVTAFKPYVGHNLGGSAILETIILLLAMQKNQIPATLNCDSLENKYNIPVVQKLTQKPLKTAMKLSCGFAGYNAAAIFRKA
jgi:3-oxoacyl-[acyl-carrier-protein] synthase II